MSTYMETLVFICVETMPIIFYTLGNTMQSDKRPASPKCPSSGNLYIKSNWLALYRVDVAMCLDFSNSDDVFLRLWKP